MKKLIFSMLFIGLVVPFAVKADMVSDLQAQIQALLAQINQLQTQLTTLQGGTTVAWCYDFNTNLKIGDEGENVLELRTALQKEGLMPIPERGVAAFGIFDESVAAAVTGFQQKYADEILKPLGLKYGTGYVGKSTRAKLNSLYGCNVPTPPVSTPSITVLSPKPNEIISSPLKITGYVNNIDNWIAFEGQAGIVILVDSNGLERGKSVLKATGDWTKTPTYFEAILNWTPVSFEGTVAKTGTLVFKNENPSGLLTKDRQFTIPVSLSAPVTTNQPPVIDSVSGPSTLNVGQLGTWTIKAHDPEGSQMSYDVSWGDEVPVKVAYDTSTSPHFTQNLIIYHSYSSAGIYTPTFTISDGSLSAKTSISVNVGGVAVATPSVGDVNGDGAVNVNDAMIVGQYVKGLVNITGEKIAKGDVNQDGKISTNDAKLIGLYDVKVITSLPYSLVVGDVDGDGKVSMNDGMIIGQYASGLRTLSQIQLAAADVNNDDQITKLDADIVGNYLAQKIAAIPVPYLSANAQKLDYNNDGVLNIADWNFLTDVFLGKQVCPSGKVCDVNQDGQLATIADVQKLSNIINGLTPVPDFGLVPRTGSVTVLSPNGGEALIKGLTYVSKWTSFSFGSDAVAQIQLRDAVNKSQMVKLIVSSASNTGTYNWTVPTDLPDDGRYFFWVTVMSGYDSLGNRVLGDDFSDAPFSIIASATTATTTASTGTITVSSSNVVPAQNISIGITNQRLGAVSVNVQGEAISVGKIVFNVTLGNEDSNDDVDDITDATLIDENGTVVAGSVNGNAAPDVAVGANIGGDGAIAFNNTVIFPVGIHTYTLRGKLGNDLNSPANITVTASTFPSTQWTVVRGQTTGSAIILSPNSAVMLPITTLKSANLTASLASTPVSQNITAGSQQVVFANFIFDAVNSGEDINVSSIPLTAAVGGMISNLTNCKLYDGSTLLNGTNIVNPSSNAGAVFYLDGALSIARGTSKQITLKCDVSASAPANSTYKWGPKTFTAVGATSGNAVAVNLAGDLWGPTMTVVAASTPALSANAQKLDYNNDGKLDTSDSAILSDYWSKNACPSGRICDVNRSGVFTVADVQTLTNIILGTASVPDYKTSLLEANAQKLDYNNDGKIDQSDSAVLTDVYLGKITCPTGKVCDVNQDGTSAAISDIQKLNNIISGSTAIPNYGATSQADLTQMAGVLEGMKGILENLGNLLK